MASLTKYLAFFLLLLLAGPVAATISGMARLGGDWRTASRDSAGIAPDPAAVSEPVIQVYGARAFGWRGAFAVHTWIAAKARNAPRYTVYEVTGWRFWHGGNGFAKHQDAHPDRYWFGSPPEVYLELRGERAEALIEQIDAAAASYPYQQSYRTWPGPNSNTFTAHVARAVPELRLDLPPTAIGKDYLGNTTFAASSPSSTGYQLSLFGILGLLVGKEEGLEVNLLGLTFGIDPNDLAVKLPGLGRLGLG